jgi:hypothetical protein
VIAKVFNFADKCIMIIKMLRKFLLITLICLPVIADCQDIFANFRHQSPSFFAINAGCSFAGGRYGQKSIYSNYDNPYEINVPKLPLTGNSAYNVLGFATPGISVNANGAWYFMKFLGIGMRAAINQNFLSCNSLEKEYTSAYGDGYNFDFKTTDFYYFAFINPALFVSLPINKSLFVSLEAGFGPYYTHFPTYRCTYICDNAVITETTKTDDNWDFSFYFAMGLKYRTQGRVGLNLDLAYGEVYSEYKLNTDYNPGNTVETVAPLFYNNLSLSLGIIFYFGKIENFDLED